MDNVSYKLRPNFIAKMRASAMRVHRLANAVERGERNDRMTEGKRLRVIVGRMLSMGNGEDMTTTLCNPDPSAIPSAANL